MATKDKFVSHTQRSQLLPSRDLISELMLASLSQGEMVDLLLGQVNVAKSQRQNQWLKTVAAEASSLQFHEDEWIENNIYRLHKAPKKESEMPAETRDIRLTDPSFPRKVEEVSPEDDGALSMKQLGEMLPESSGEPMEASGPVPGNSSGEPEKTEEPKKDEEPKKAEEPKKVDKPDQPLPDRVARDKTPPRTTPRDETALRRSPRKHKGSRDVPRRQSPRKGREPARETQRQVPTTSQRRPRSRDGHSSAKHKPTYHRRQSRDEGRREPRKRHSSRSPKQRRREDGSHARRHEDKRPRLDRPGASKTYAEATSGSRNEDRRPQPDRPGASKTYVEATSGSRNEDRRLQLGRPGASKTYAEAASGSRMMPAATKGLKSSVCPVPGCVSRISRSHAFQDHVPGIFDEEQMLTEEVSRRRVSALRLCANAVLGSLNLNELARYVSDLNPLRPGELQVNKACRKSMTHLCSDQGWEAPDAFDLTDSYQPWALINWRLMLVVIASMPEGEAERLRQSYPAVSPPEPEVLPEGFDSHFHLDRTSRRVRKKEIQQVIAGAQPEAEFRIRVTGGIAVFCDPKSYPTPEESAELAESGFGVAIGLHPKPHFKEAYDEADWEAFTRCLTFPGVKALGEVGIDYSAEADRWAEQHKVLDRAVRSLRPEHVLVLHNRPPKNRPDDEMVQLLYQLKGVVPREQKIHLHCFLGPAQTVELWLQEFPNTHFGYTGDRIVRASYEDKEALRQMPEDRILLETDAPYFTMLPQQQFSTPALLGMVAKHVADVRGQDWTHVMRVAEHNARRLYNLPLD